jgi:cytoskeleton protein RodZ
VMSQLLKAGQSVPVPNQPGLVLTTGNAGALEVVVDGVLLPALGRDRAVVRGVPLDPASLKDRLG